MGGCFSIVFEDARDQAEKGPTFKIDPTTQDWDQSQNKNKVNRLSKQSNRQSVKTNRSHRHSKQSLVVPCQSHDQISVGRYSQISVTPSIREDAVLESLCQTTNIEVDRMRGNEVSARERKKLFNKFERHSQTARIFESENNLHDFVTDVYQKGADRESQLSLAVPTRTMSVQGNGSNHSIRSTASVSGLPDRNAPLGNRFSNQFGLKRTSSNQSIQSRQSMQSIQSRLSDKKGFMSTIEKGVERNIRKMLNEDLKLSKPKKKERYSETHLRQKPNYQINRQSTIMENTTTSITQIL